jgi:hypothetical protein
MKPRYLFASALLGILICGAALAKPHHHRREKASIAAAVEAPPSPVGVYAETGTTFALPLKVDPSISVPGMVRIIDANGVVVGWFTAAAQVEAVTRLNASWGLWVVDAANPPSAGAVGARLSAPVRIGRDDIPFRREDRDKGPQK